MNKLKLDLDCTRRCKSLKHGEILTSAITKRSVTDEELASFIKGTCANFSHVYDQYGHTALHMAVSCGRSRLASWLARHSSETFVNARDEESWYTPLHRSLFYGQIHIAVSLIKMGINMDIVDKDDFRAIQHSMRDRQYMVPEKSQPYELYVWGTNSNYTLGTGSQQQKKTPDLHPYRMFQRSSMKQVCLGKFHSVFVSEAGEVWVCGQIGRAGAPAGGIAVRPAPLKLHEPCLYAAITLDSTILLLSSGIVIQYSLKNVDNSSQSSSHVPEYIKLQQNKSLKKLASPLGLFASRNHAVVWNSAGVYTWGTNVGQLGHSTPEDKYVEIPRKVAILLNDRDDSSIQLAAVSDAATVFTTARGDVYLLHKYLCKKIAVKQINIKQICVDAKVNEHDVYSRVTVLLLTNIGQLYLWQDNYNRLLRCVYNLSHKTYIDDVTLTHDAIYFVTKYGEAYTGTVSRKTTPPPQNTKKNKEKDNLKSDLVKFLEKDDCIKVRLTRIPNLHRAVSIAVDNEGINFACLQPLPHAGIKSWPQLSPTSITKHMDTLLGTCSEDDLLHDVVFKVGTKTYPAHMFIISSHSPYLHQLYQDHMVNNPNEKPLIILENILPEVFDRIIQFMYTGSCDVVRAGYCDLKVRREDLTDDKDKESNHVEAETIENPSEISAYEVYKKQEKPKKNNSKNRRNSTPQAVPKSPYYDPVKLVQTASKRLQVMALHSLLEKFYSQNNSICPRATFNSSSVKPVAWSRDHAPELVDTNVCSKDGVPLPAHKCILAARLEYFNGMFMHSWTESKLSTVSLPINHNILLPVIDFLYTDQCPEIEKSESLDFICSLLIVADQLFITRLTEMCEIALASMVNLKNCAELCQFAHTYNAAQLKQFCMEFISLNLCNILESRSLDILDEALLEDISKYYCKFNPIMSCRIITPFFNAPTDETLQEIAKRMPVDLDVVDEEIKSNDVEMSKKKKSNIKKADYTVNEKARRRYESVSLDTSLDLSNDTSGDIALSLSKISIEKGTNEKQEKWIDTPSPQQKVMQARLKAISKAKELLDTPLTESFVTLTKNTSSASIASSPGDLRLSMSPKEASFPELIRSPQGSLTISHIGPKLSQKQRKKMALHNSEIPPQIQTQEEVQEKPKNPWKTIELPTTSTPKNKSVQFNQILVDQKKQKDDSSRIMTKPLNLTQLEDKAIEELEKFYNIHEVDDELISVQRIELQVSSPQWVHSAPK